MISFQTYLRLLAYELKISSVSIKSQCVWKIPTVYDKNECICHQGTENKKQREQYFFSLTLYENVFNLHVHKAFRNWYASCIRQWGSATPSPDPVIIPNSFIHILIFSHSPFLPLLPSSLSWQTEHYFRDTQICSKYLESAQVPFQNTESPGAGT